MYNPRQLLELQKIDSRIDRYLYDKVNLPEKRELLEIDKKLEKLNAIKSDHDNRLKKALADQKKLEDDLDLLSGKTGKEEKRLYDGSVSSPKELKSLQDEITILKTANDNRETELIEVIEKAEALEAENEKLGRAGEDFLKTKGELIDKINSYDLSLDERIKEARKERASTVKDISEDVIGLYEKLREEKNGLAVALLDEGTCKGCNISLPAQELNELTDPSKIWRCAHCRRILVKP